MNRSEANTLAADLAEAYHWEPTHGDAIALRDVLLGLDRPTVSKAASSGKQRARNNRAPFTIAHLVADLQMIHRRRLDNPPPTPSPTASTDDEPTPAATGRIPDATIRRGLGAIAAIRAEYFE